LFVLESLLYLNNFSYELLVTFWSFFQSGVGFMRGVVKEVHPKNIVLNDGTNVPYGLLVWSTGVGPSQFVKSLDLPKSPGGRY
jgi:NADH dehydrogenase FAD-containing subunit